MKILQTFLLLILFFPSIEIFGQLSFTAHNNVGIGGFGGQKDYLVTADLDGDGISDLVESNGSTQLGVVFLNEDGLFKSSSTLSTGSVTVYGVAAADFDLDGDVDIAAVGVGTLHSLTLFKNNGNGTFGGATNFNLPSAPPINANGSRELISYDYNKDGYLDVISLVQRSDLSYALAIYENNTSGGFTAIRRVISGVTPTYDNKHKMSFGVLDNTSGKIEIYLVMGSSSLYKITDVDSSPSSAVFYSGVGGDIFGDVKVGDFNLDGNADIALTSRGNSNPNNYLKVSTGDGTGNIVDYYLLTFAANADLENITVQDIDNDTDLDIFVSKKGNPGPDPNRKIHVFENLIIDIFPSASFNLAAPILMPTNNPPTQIAIADFNVDGKLDIAVPIVGGDDIDRFLNTSPLADVPILSDVSVATFGAGFINTSLLLSKTTNFTIEGYFVADPTFTGHRQYLFYNGFTGVDGFGVYIDDTGSGELFIEGVDNGGSPFDFSTGMNVASYTEWNHFAVVVDKSGNWHFYLNGVPRFNISNIALMPPTNNTLIGARNLTAPPASLGIDNGNLQEFRFWNTALDTKTIREWAHIQLDNTHPVYFTLHSYFPLNENIGTTVRDLAYTINPIALYKTGNIVSPGNWDNTDSAPIGDNGSGEVENAAADINSRIKTGIEINFQTAPGGDVVISRMFEEKEATFYPNQPTYIFSKVFWTFQQYGGSTTFPDLDEITIDIKDDQFISGLYPILNTPSDPNPAASAFKIFMRRIGSTDQTQWIQVGEGIGFGSVKARRPGSTVSEFGREMVVGVDPTVLPVRLVSFTGRKLTPETNLLEWKTAFEFENEAFEVEKSYDGKTFFRIGAVEGKDKTNQMSHYKFEDTQAAEAGYYRLRQKDKSGKISYTKPIYIASENPYETFFKVYPNPVSEEVYLITQFIETEYLKLALYNNQGERIHLWEGNKQQLEYLLNKNLSHLQKGLYILKISNDYQTYQTKFIKN